MGSIFVSHSAWALLLEFSRQGSLDATHLAVYRMGSDDGDFPNINIINATAEKN